MKRQFNHELITTADGSHSLFLPDLNETYHSQHGALQESLHVFIRKGMDDWRAEHPGMATLHIFEVGFGTGLNALLAWQYAEQNGIKVRYTSIEPFPIPPAIAEKINYGDLLGKPWQERFVQLHKTPWDQEEALSTCFVLHKMETRLEEITPFGESQIVFFDAFAPNKQSELWETAPLKTCYDMTAPGGFFVTYCAQGQFKRNLKAAGYAVERLPGPPGKKEMTRGRKGQ